MTAAAMQRLAVVLTGACVLMLHPVWAGAAVAANPDGRALYRKHCASCHGLSARGDGPDAAAFAEKPRDLRTGFLEKYSTDELVRRVRDGAALQLALDLPALQARAQDVNAVVSYMKRLPQIDWDLSFRGWALYDDHCVLCHGRYGAPPQELPVGVRAPRDLSDPAFQAAVSNQQLMSAVRHGRRAMPALVPRVPESAAKPLTAFVRLLSPGFQLYSTYCAACHGDNGRAPAESLDIPGIPHVTFDRRYFAQHDPEQLHQAVWHMLSTQKPAMPHYRWRLTDAETRAIVEYLKHSQ